jgi:hypothetical protein
MNEQTKSKIGLATAVLPGIAAVAGIVSGAAIWSVGGFTTIVVLLALLAGKVSAPKPALARVRPYKK